jgi:kinetochore protein NDC80
MASDALGNLPLVLAFAHIAFWRLSAFRLFCRASIYGGRAGASSARKADPRPLSDRDFITEQLNDLIRYLVSNSYNQRISPKLFNPPTGKEFKNVVTFLFRLLDDGYELTGRVEDEVPMIFKGLHYPFGISKTGLTAVGSPHTWPALLGALSWLVELLEYDSAVRMAEEAEEGGAGSGEADGGDERMFFSYLRESYAAFLDDDTQRFKDLDAEISTTFRGKHDEIEAETCAFEDESARIREELEELRAKRTHLPALEAKRADLVSDKGKFETLIQQLTEHKAALDHKLAQRVEEAEGKEAEQREAEEALAGVRHTIETQELSVDDVERIQAQRQRHMEKAAATAKQKEEARRELAEAEAVLAAAIEGLEGQLVEYHKAASSLHLLAPDDDNAAGIDYELELDTSMLTPDADLTSDTIGHSAAGGSSGSGRRESLSAQLSKLSTAQILGTDVRGVIKPALRELKTSLHRRTIEERGRETELADAAEAAGEAVEDCRQRLQEADRRVQSLTDTFKRERAANERTLQHLVEQTDAAEKQVEEARDALQAAEDDAISLDERALRRIREESTRRVQSARARADSAVSALRSDTLAVTRHVDAVRRRLQAAASASEAIVAGGAAEVEALAARVEAACAEEEARANF